MEVTFKIWKCKVQFARYANDRIAIQLVDHEDGEPIATASVNLPEYDLPADHVIIKDWSENEGMYETLIEAGLITETDLEVPSGFVLAPVGKFTPEALTEINKAKAPEKEVKAYVIEWTTGDSTNWKDVHFGYDIQDALNAFLMNPKQKLENVLGIELKRPKHTIGNY
jgi:hypothetical protein